MDKPKITVMIPVYNMKDVIGRAIESVILQDYENKELMVLDGGSTDGTIEVIESYMKNIDYVAKDSIYQYDDSYVLAQNISNNITTNNTNTTLLL